MYIYVIYVYTHIYCWRNITTEPHAQDISADAYYIYIYIYIYALWNLRFNK